jgi:hypothetical protein
MANIEMAGWKAVNALSLHWQSRLLINDAVSDLEQQ